MDAAGAAVRGHTREAHGEAVERDDAPYASARRAPQVRRSALTNARRVLVLPP
ncbi:hypothetical protein [Streptomyces sp. NPDC005525]|uniref:hypothetical protein n=1 Tax=Streptomyces sp. NPDC005525 TaxID=3364720 RepID=UPI0036A0E95A